MEKKEQTITVRATSFTEMLKLVGDLKRESIYQTATVDALAELVIETLALNSDQSIDQVRGRFHQFRKAAIEAAVQAEKPGPV